MSLKDAIASEMSEAGRGVQANLEGTAGQYARQDTRHQTADARHHATEAEQEHHAAAHADRDAQREAAEAEAAQARINEADGPEYGD